MCHFLIIIGFLMVLKQNMHDRCFVKLLVDVCYAKDKKNVCIRTKPVSDVALACRRVGSKRVKALSSSKFFFIIRTNHIDKMCCYNTEHLC